MIDYTNLEQASACHFNYNIYMYCIESNIGIPPGSHTYCKVTFHLLIPNTHYIANAKPQDEVCLIDHDHLVTNESDGKHTHACHQEYILLMPLI